MTNSLQDRTEHLQDRYGLKLASYLSMAAAELPYDVSERLRAARVQAISKRKLSPALSAGSIRYVGNGSAAMTWGAEMDDLNGWSRIGSLLPLLVLVLGLLMIHSVHNDSRARELAEVDTALLIDELPPAAFADPGFVQFLKTTH